MLQWLSNGQVTQQRLIFAQQTQHGKLRSTVRTNKHTDPVWEAGRSGALTEIR